MEEFKEELNVVEKYLVHRDYHNEFSKAEKTNLRRKCRNNYKMEDGVSHYRKRKEAMWHTCIRRDERKSASWSCVIMDWQVCETFFFSPG